MSSRNPLVNSHNTTWNPLWMTSGLAVRKWVRKRPLMQPATAFAMACALQHPLGRALSHTARAFSLADLRAKLRNNRQSFAQMPARLAMTGSFAFLLGRGRLQYSQKIIAHGGRAPCVLPPFLSLQHSLQQLLAAPSQCRLTDSALLSAALALPLHPKPLAVRAMTRCSLPVLALPLARFATTLAFAANKLIAASRGIISFVKAIHALGMGGFFISTRKTVHT